MGYEAVQSLLDRALPDAERDEIFYRDLLAWRQRCARSSNAAVRADPLYSDSFEMEDNLPLVQAHVIAEQVEQAILQRFPGSDVIIHQDPCSVVPGHVGLS
jgi:ferrous-iron efflux pump FieF